MTAVDASSADRKDQKTRDAEHRNVLRALTGILAAFFMAMVTLTIIGTALPVIMADLGGDQTALSWTVTGTLLANAVFSGDQTALSWTVTGTLLANAVFTPIFGKLADLFDKKKLLLLAILIFVLGSGCRGP